MGISARGSIRTLLLLAMPATLTACAGTPDSPETFTLPAGESTVVLTVKSYSFSPESIVARAGEKLVLQVENSSGSDHNITIENPAGRTLRSVDLPARERIPVTIPLGKAGRYPFYCDQPYHGTLGMKGEITAR